MVSVSGAGTSILTSNLLREVLARGQLDFLASFAQIPDKEAEGVRHPFVAWPVQRKVVERLTGRDVILKPAQIGITSIISGVFLIDTAYTPDTTTVILAHKGSTTERLLNRMRVVLKSIPEQIRPTIDHDSATEIRFPVINSVIYIVTAREEVAGRGEPIHRLLLSEAAFYLPDSFKNVIYPAIQRVPRSGKIVYESTPNSEDLLFYPMVQKCLDGKSDYHLQVIYWWENPDNWLPQGTYLVQDSDKYALNYTDEELLLAKAHSLTEDQVRWRRWKIREGEELFWQEHIEDINTCFLTFGEQFYDKYRLLELAKGCGPAPYSFEGARVWNKPEEGRTYVMGVDPGQGKVSDSVATVWQDMGGMVRHEATLAGKIESPAMAVKVRNLANYYNQALIVAEANSHGIALVAALSNYRRMYWRRDTVSGKLGSQLGWLTTPRTKPYMMSELGRNLQSMETHDEVLVKQIGGFREVGVGKLPVTNLADDYHDSACLAMIGLSSGGQMKARGYVGQLGFKW